MTSPCRVRKSDAAATVPLGSAFSCVQGAFLRYKAKDITPRKRNGVRLGRTLHVAGPMMRDVLEKLWDGH
jgi:hypothetical protein